MGVMDGAWIVRQVSVDSPIPLGGPTAELLGTCLLDRVCDQDHGRLHEAWTIATTERRSASANVHMGRPGTWTCAQVTLAPMVQHPQDLGFVITAARRPRATPAPETRSAQLEQHLHRIARELHAAGIALRPEAPGLAIDVEQLPDVGDLSPRQWEVLRRLLRGERVPGIAKEMYLAASTVRNHLTAIFAKFGVHSQEELIARVRHPPVASAP